MPYVPHYRYIWVIVRDSCGQNQHQHYKATSSAPPPHKQSKSGLVYPTPFSECPLLKPE